MTCAELGKKIGAICGKFFAGRFARKPGLCRTIAGGKGRLSADGVPGASSWANRPPKKVDLKLSMSVFSEGG